MKPRRPLYEKLDIKWITIAANWIAVFGFLYAIFTTTKPSIVVSIMESFLNPELVAAWHEWATHNWFTTVYVGFNILWTFYMEVRISGHARKEREKLEQLFAQYKKHNDYVLWEMGFFKKHGRWPTALDKPETWLPT